MQKSFGLYIKPHRALSLLHRGKLQFPNRDATRFFCVILLTVFNKKIHTQALKNQEPDSTKLSNCLRNHLNPFFEFRNQKGWKSFLQTDSQDCPFNDLRGIKENIRHCKSCQDH